MAPLLPHDRHLRLHLRRRVLRKSSVSVASRAASASAYSARSSSATLAAKLWVVLWLLVINRLDVGDDRMHGCFLGRCGSTVDAAVEALDRVRGLQRSPGIGDHDPSRAIGVLERLFRLFPAQSIVERLTVTLAGRGDSGVVKSIRSIRGDVAGI